MKNIFSPNTKPLFGYIKSEQMGGDSWIIVSAQVQFRLWISDLGLTILLKNLDTINKMKTKSQMLDRWIVAFIFNMNPKF